ncbi:MAG: TIM barrel protein [Rhodopirellula sp.]|nr:TIM barrel protein [Rhodopirellula sp.]
MTSVDRRSFLKWSLSLGAAAMTPATFGQTAASASLSRGGDMAFGLVTYQWGQSWDLPTLIRNCAAAEVLGVELRTTHAHGVEPGLSAEQRRQVKAHFADSPVQLVGLGSNERFDHPRPEALAEAIETTKEFIRLSHDVGGTGVKVKPNDLPKGVEPAKTIAQIGKSLNTVGAFGADYGQQIRLEVHGQCARLPIIKQILDVADHPNVFVCWNSNQQDLLDEGLTHNFNLVKDRFGATAHVRPLDTPGYPWQDLMALFVKMDYAGWLLLEAGGSPPGDPVEAMARQRKMFEDLVSAARKEIDHRPKR